MSYAVTLPAGVGSFALPHPFPLEHGGALQGAQLAFELLDDDAPAGAPLVVVLGGISAGRHVARGATDPSAGWWDALVGLGAALDTRTVRVLGIDFLGGGGASSGPLSAGLRPFPLLSTGDHARALEPLVREVAATAPVALVGASFGGMVGLALAECAPDLLAKLVVISAPDRPHPRASAWRWLQRRIVELGLRTGTVTEAMAIARGLAMTSYRGADELRERFDGAPRLDGERQPPVADYLRARGAAFAEAFDPHAFLALSGALDLHRVDPARIHTPTTVVAVDRDELVPLAQLRELAARLAGPAELVVLSSCHGHDAFLIEHHALGAVLRTALLGLEVR